MTRRLATPLLAIAAVMLASSCGGPTTEESTSSPAAEPTEVGAVSGVVELQEAYVAAGGDCDGDLENLNAMTIATASGVCPGSGTVLSTYVSHEDAEDNVKTLMDFLEGLGSTLILGENWVINPSGGDKELTDDIAEAMGGQVLRQEETPVTSLDDARSVDDALEVYQHVDGAECDDPEDTRQSGSSTPVYACEDGAIILDTGLTADTPAEQQAAANSIEEGTDPTVGTPVVGREYTIVVPDNLDADEVAAQVDGTAADNA